MNKLDVLYTVDHNYSRYMLVSLLSLLESNNDKSITVHIVCDGFTIADYQNVLNIIDKYEKANVHFHHFSDIKKLIKEYNIPDWRGSSISNARLFFNQIVKDTDNLLYLDSDTIVVDKLDKLGMYNGPICMVEDTMTRDHIDELNCSIVHYFNSGVIWIDVNEWNKQNFDQLLIDTLDSKIPYEFPDQDLINLAYKGKIHPLHPKYNLFSTEAYFNQTDLKQYYKINNIERYNPTLIQEAKDKPAILHCTPLYQYRPWDNTRGIHPYEKIYNKYSSMIFGTPIVNSDIKVPNKHIYRIMTSAKLYTPKPIKDGIKSLITKK